MKFVAFNVREDERRYFEEWSKENGIEVSLKKEEITPDNVSETVGYDAVIGLQTGLYPDNLFKELSDANIKVFSVRNVGVDNINLDDAKPLRSFCSFCATRICSAKEWPNKIIVGHRSSEKNLAK